MTVETETLPGLMERLGVARADVVKADIEGAEIRIFDACTGAELLRETSTPSSSTTSAT